MEICISPICFALEMEMINSSISKVEPFGSSSLERCQELCLWLLEALELLELTNQLAALRFITLMSVFKLLLNSTS